MFFEGPVSQKPVIYHRKAFSSCMDQAERNHRNYLVLLAHFSDNLNASVKHLQDCIQDLEEHPRFKISKVEKQLLNCGLSYLCEENLDRLCKESYYRNAIIRKHYNVFLDNYSLFYFKVHRTEYPKTKHSSSKNSYKEQKSQRQTLHYQTTSKMSNIAQRRQTKNSASFTKPMLFQLNVSMSLQKQNFEVSKVVSSKKASSRLDQWKKMTKFAASDKKQDDFTVKGDHVIVSECRTKNEEQQENWQCLKTINNPVQSFCTNRVLAFRNRVSTNPQFQQKQRILKQNKMLKASFMKTHNSSNRKRTYNALQQQIKLIINNK